MEDLEGELLKKHRSFRAEKDLYLNAAENA